jgi:hypothetical protein
MRRTLSYAFLLGACVLAGCDDPESVRVEETRARLVGSWLEEAESGGAKSRRVVFLGADGKFTDRIVVSSSGTAAERREFAGEWSFDGTNLKRRYMQENGRQFSGGGMRFATVPVKSVTPSELVIDDNVQGREGRYRRVGDGTQP